MTRFECLCTRSSHSCGASPCMRSTAATAVGRHRACAASQPHLWDATEYAQHSSCCCRYRCMTALIAVGYIRVRSDFSQKNIGILYANIWTPSKIILNRCDTFDVLVIMKLGKYAKNETLKHFALIWMTPMDATGVKTPANSMPPQWKMSRTVIRPEITEGKIDLTLLTRAMLGIENTLTTKHTKRNNTQTKHETPGGVPRD